MQGANKAISKKSGTHWCNKLQSSETIKLDKNWFWPKYSPASDRFKKRTNITLMFLSKLKICRKIHLGDPIGLNDNLSS